MKRSLILLSLIWLCACGAPRSDEKGSNQDVHELESAEEYTDSLDAIESIDDPEKEQISNAINTLLLSPIDLPAYKAEYGPSNSGGGIDEMLFDTPDTAGFMYRYILFQKLRRVLDSHPAEAALFDKFRIHVFMFGDEVGDFNDNNEELMAIECALDNTTLGDLNVYGLQKNELIEKFGEPQFQQDDLFIYAREDNKVLSVHFNTNGVDAEKANWFKYARLNKTIELSTEIPEFLTQF